MRAALAAAVLLAALPAHAIDGAAMERPLCDPCVSPASKKSAVPAEPTRGAALRAQVESKLRHEFDRGAREGRMSREQARAAGLGFIARNFDAIDAAGRGTISFEDYRRFLEARADDTRNSLQR